MKSFSVDSSKIGYWEIIFSVTIFTARYKRFRKNVLPLNTTRELLKKYIYTFSDNFFLFFSNKEPVLPEKFRFPIFCAMSLCTWKKIKITLYNLTIDRGTLSKFPKQLYILVTCPRPQLQAERGVFPYILCDVYMYAPTEMFSYSNRIPFNCLYLQRKSFSNYSIQFLFFFILRFLLKLAFGVTWCIF